MKTKLTLAMATVLVLGLAIVAFAYTTTSTTSTAAASSCACCGDSCPMKNGDHSMSGMDMKGMDMKHDKNMKDGSCSCCHHDKDKKDTAKAGI